MNKELNISSKDRVKKISFLDSQIISVQQNRQNLRMLRNRLKRIPQVLRRISNSQRKHKRQQEQSALVIQKNIRGALDRERQKKNIESWGYMNESVRVTVDTCQSLFRKLYRLPVSTIQTALRRFFARKTVDKIIEENKSRKIIEDKKKMFIENTKYKKHNIGISKDLLGHNSSDNMRWKTFNKWWNDHRDNIPVISKQKSIRKTYSREDSNSQSISGCEDIDKFSRTSYGDSPRPSFCSVPPQIIKPVQIVHKVLTTNHLKPTQSFLNNVFWRKGQAQSQEISRSAQREGKTHLDLRGNKFPMDKREVHFCKGKNHNNKKVWVPCMVYSPQTPRPLPNVTIRPFKLPEFIGEFQQFRDSNEGLYQSFESDASCGEIISNGYYSSKIEVALPEINKLVNLYKTNLGSN